MTPQALKNRLQSLSQGTKAHVQDLTGTQDHYQATIFSPAFKGKSIMEQHRMVFKLIQAELDSGEVHALTLKTRSSEILSPS